MRSGGYSALTRPPGPVEIRDDLLKMAIGVGQVSLLLSIHTVLRRMVEGGEIERMIQSFVCRAV
jgi:hypothetical protein